MRKVISSLAALLMLLAMSTASVSAAPRETILVPIFGTILSVENGVVIFWNITRADFCAWEAGGFVGDPPVIELVPIEQHLTGNGVTIQSYTATRPVEVWTLDADADFTSPCTDTDSSTEPWAVGFTKDHGTDNDLLVTQTRVNSFGGTSHGMVVDVDGQAWSLTNVFRAQIFPDGEFGEFVLRVDKIELRPR